jgi:signal transduction histidine kinase
VKDLSIAARLMGGFGAVIACIAVAAAITVNGFRSASVHYDAALSACSKRALACMELEVAFLEQVKAQKNYLLRDDPEYLQRAVGNSGRVRGALARLQDIAQDVPERRLLGELESTLDGLDRAFEAHVEVRKGGGLEAADAVMRGRATSVARILNEIVAAAQEHALEESASAAAAAHRTQLITVGLIACIGAVALGIGGALSLSITRPLQRLQAQIDAVADGEAIPSKPAAEGRNEIASIARAFRDLVRKAALLREMEARSRRLMAFSSRIAQAQEEERGRIARELHDSLGQALTAMKLDLSAATQSLVDDPLAGKEHLARAQYVADQSLDELRRLVFDLRPPALDNLGLVAALESYIRDLKERSGLAVTFEADDAESRLPPEVETALYRISQEALTNVWKHASATAALVRLGRSGNVVNLLITDNGVGFDTAGVVRANGALTGVGLLSMERRAEDLGGTFEVESRQGAGARVQVAIPCRLRGES